MQLLLKDDVKFNVNSFNESLNISEESSGAVNMSVTVNISYADSLENLISVLSGLDTDSFTIKDNESEKHRVYTGYSFESAEQRVEDFHRIETALRFVKKYSE